MQVGTGNLKSPDQLHPVFGTFTPTIMIKKSIINKPIMPKDCGLKIPIQPVKQVSKNYMALDERHFLRLNLLSAHCIV